MSAAEEYTETYAEQAEQDAAPIGGFMTLGGAVVPTPFPCAWAPGYETKAWPQRRAAIVGIVLHETAGHTAGSALNAWRAGSVGAEFIVDIDGSVLQCADPILSAPWHAGAWSPAHVGIEFVCPVTDRSPYSKPKGAAWPEPWLSAPRESHGRDTPFAWIEPELGRGLYVPPFPCQLETGNALVRFLRSHVHGLFGCQPIDRDAWKLDDKTPRAGIVAHGQVSGDRTDGYGTLRSLPMVLT